jgi:hypothetical protein
VLHSKRAVHQGAGSWSAEHDASVCNHSLLWHIVTQGGARLCIRIDALLTSHRQGELDSVIFDGFFETRAQYLVLMEHHWTTTLDPLRQRFAAHEAAYMVWRRSFGVQRPHPHDVDNNVVAHYFKDRVALDALKKTPHLLLRQLETIFLNRTGNPPPHEKNNNNNDNNKSSTQQQQRSSSRATAAAMASKQQGTHRHTRRSTYAC